MRALLPLTLLICVPVASAQSFNFTSGTQSWNVPGNWTPSGVPNGIDASAAITTTATQTVNLSAAITVGTINLTNNHASQLMTLANGTGGSLTFGVTTGNAEITFGGTSTMTNAHTVSATITLNDTLEATVNTLGTGSATATFTTGGIGGAGGFIKTGPGRLSFTNTAKTYAGATDINEGRLRFTGAGVASGTSAINVASGGMLMLDQIAGTFTFGSGGAALITLNGAGTAEASQNEGALRKENTGVTVLTNNVQLGSASTIHVSSGGLRLDGTFTGSTLLTKTGQGVLNFNTAGAFSGGLTIREGEVQFLQASAANWGILSLAQTAGNSTGATFSANTTISNPSTTWTDVTGVRSQQLFLNGVGVTLTIDQTTNTTLGNGAVATLEGRIIGTGNLTLSAASTGILTLAGPLTYTGTTTINGGTLRIDGVKSGTGAVNVNGGFLGGNGQIFGSTSVLAGAIAPGSSAGQLTFETALTFTAGTYEWELAALTTLGAGTNFDLITVTAGANLVGGTAEVTLSFIGTALDPNSGDPFWTAPHQWQIMNRTGGTLAGNFAGVSNDTWTSGIFTVSADADQVFLNFTPVAVPEPATVALCGLLVLGGGGTWWHRRRARALLQAESEQEMDQPADA